MKKEKQLPTEQTTVSPVELSEAEISRKASFLERTKEKVSPPLIKVTREIKVAGESANVVIAPHPKQDNTLYCAGLSEAFGTLDVKVIEMMMGQASDFAGDDPTSERTINTALAYMHDVKPQDTFEAMLAIQMLATHKLSLSCMRRISKKGGVSLEEMNTYLNLGTKLSRTYVAQMEALNRHRGKGQQKMTVEHVHVNAGGQAIIGSVEKKRG